MKLYYVPGACSLAPHIVLREVEVKFELEAVNLRTGQTSKGDFKILNPKGYVPLLELHNGQTLTEVAVILQYIADFHPEKRLMPAAGTLERYRCLEWLNFIATEVHKTFSPLFRKETPEVYASQIKETLGMRFEYVSRNLSGNEYLMGKDFTIADAYLFTILNWAGFLGIDLKPWPTLTQYMERMKKRPSVIEALKAEGIA